jgi:hypothetical protein
VKDFVFCLSGAGFHRILFPHLTRATGVPSADPFLSAALIVARVSRRSGLRDSTQKSQG